MNGILIIALTVIEVLLAVASVALHVLSVMQVHMHWQDLRVRQLVHCVLLANTATQLGLMNALFAPSGHIPLPKPHRACNAKLVNMGFLMACVTCVLLANTLLQLGQQPAKSAESVFLRCMVFHASHASEAPLIPCLEASLLANRVTSGTTRPPTGQQRPASAAA